MPQFTITRHIEAPVDVVWEILDDYGDIQRWNPGVTASALTSAGPVTEGSTRHCDLKPFGAINERIVHYETHQRMTIAIFEASRLPISSAEADFELAPAGDGTQLTVNYSYSLNLLGRLLPSYTDKQLRKGIGALARSLQEESEGTARRT